MTTRLSCRACGADLENTFVDLGETPLANAYLAPEALEELEACYPLHVRVCQRCFLVQLPALVSPDEIFAEYPYFSSYSTSWVEQARRFADHTITRFSLGAASRVVEVASNDGYLLRHYVSAGIPVLGIEPAKNVAVAAMEAGVPTEVKFFGEDAARDLLKRGIRADLLIGNNVLAHVPDLHDFVAGLSAVLEPAGVLSVEFPHVLRLIEGVQFDTIYHEHLSYFSFLVVERIFDQHRLTVFDVEELSTHGGSLRVFASRTDGFSRAPMPAVGNLRAAERTAGLDRLEAYEGFSKRVSMVKYALLDFLHEAKASGQTVAAYGAAAKGNTLLNTCGVGPDLIQWVVDRNPHKQGRFLPGSHLPILPPDEIFRVKPDFILILPWNLQAEIVEAIGGIREWGGRFVVAVPSLKVLQ